MELYNVAGTDGTTGQGAEVRAWATDAEAARAQAKAAGITVTAVTKATDQKVPVADGAVQRGGAPSIQWFYFRHGDRRGPISNQELKDLAASGVLKPTDQVWRKGLAKAVPASRLKGLFPTEVPPLALVVDEVVPTLAAVAQPVALAAPQDSMPQATSVRHRRKRMLLLGLGAVALLLCTMLVTWIALFSHGGTKPVASDAAAAPSSTTVDGYRKAAEQGNADAQFKLGVCYAKGEGVEHNWVAAVTWYRKAAEQGNAEAQYNLGGCYAGGEGVGQDSREAIKWCRRAAERGYAVAQCDLGICYARGDGVEQNPREAFTWYRKAAEQGNAEAQCNLGLCYARGDGVEQNWVAAVKWLRAAADQRNAGAQYNLGVCFDRGTGVQQDKSEAAKWFRKAAEQGNAKSQFNLGVCYKHGEGVQQDWDEAVKWYRKAAEQGLAEAQCNLGLCYAKGEGVKQDRDEAVNWFRTAAEQGSIAAKENLKKLTQR